jgi:hypothetical protein
MDCVGLTVNAQVVNRQNAEVATPVAPQRQAFTESVSGGAGGTPFTCGVVGAGLTGYLAKIKLASTGQCQWTIKSGATILGYTITNADSADVYEPPHRFYDQCPAGSSFSITPNNLTGLAITVYATAWWDQF